MDDVASDETWIDCTFIGSAYQEQLEIYSNRWRHRPLQLGSELPELPWIPGKAPRKVESSG